MIAMYAARTREVHRDAIYAKEGRKEGNIEAERFS